MQALPKYDASLTKMMVDAAPYFDHVHVFSLSGEMFVHFLPIWMQTTNSTAVMGILMTGSTNGQDMLAFRDHLI